MEKASVLGLEIAHIKIWYMPNKKPWLACSQEDIAKLFLSQKQRLQFVGKGLTLWNMILQSFLQQNVFHCMTVFPANCNAFVPPATWRMQRIFSLFSFFGKVYNVYFGGSCHHIARALWARVWHSIISLQSSFVLSIEQALFQKDQ